MTKIYKCINTLSHTQHIYNHIWLYDKLTDILIATYSTVPDAKTKQEFPVDENKVEQAINTEPEILQMVTNGDRNNLGWIYICDSNIDLVDVKDYCIENGDLVKQYKVKLECDAEDNDMDGLPDIEGDGISMANFTIKIVDSDTDNIINSFNGLVKVVTERGKIIGGQTGMITITNGTGAFQLRSVAESIDKVRVRALLTSDRLIPSMRAQQGLFEISFN